MRKAVELAVDNVRAGAGGPFGALVVRGGRIIGEGANLVTSSNDPTAHAEINAIRSACRAVGQFQLQGGVLYTTCEPCPMCLGAAYWSRLERIYFAASRADARGAGFDDEHIYEELARPVSGRRIKMTRILPEAAGRAFEAWRNDPDRIPY